MPFRDVLESLNPSVKSFLRIEKSVAICEIKSILNLISHDKPTSSTNEVDLFDFIWLTYYTLSGETVYWTWLLCCFCSRCSAIPYNVVKRVTSYEPAYWNSFHDCGFRVFHYRTICINIFYPQSSLTFITFGRNKFTGRCLNIFPKLSQDL